MSIKIMLADDHVLCREGIRQLLEFDGSIEVISEVSDGDECLKQLKNIMPQVLLLDINMPKIDGIDVLKEIKKNKYPVKVLMLTVYNEVEYILKAFDLGVEGYMVKDSEVAELKKAINCLVNGETYIQPNLVPLLNKRLDTRNTDKNKIETLTKREFEILICLTKGMSNREIASEYSISERTVKNHIFNLFKKIDVNDRTQAAVFAIKNNLVKIQ